MAFLFMMSVQYVHCWLQCLYIADAHIQKPFPASMDLSAVCTLVISSSCTMQKSTQLEVISHFLGLWDRGQDNNGQADPGCHWHSCPHLDPVEQLREQPGLSSGLPPSFFHLTLLKRAPADWQLSPAPHSDHPPPHPPATPLIKC